MSGLGKAYGFCFKTTKLLPCEKRLHESAPRCRPEGEEALARGRAVGEGWTVRACGLSAGSRLGTGARRPPGMRWARAPGPSLPGAAALQLWTRALLMVDPGASVEESGVKGPTGLLRAATRCWPVERRSWQVAGQCA